MQKISKFLWECENIYGSRYLRVDQVKIFKAVLHKFYSVYSWIPWPIWTEWSMILTKISSKVQARYFLIVCWWFSWVFLLVFTKNKFFFAVKLLVNFFERLFFKCLSICSVYILINTDIFLSLNILISFYTLWKKLLPSRLGFSANPTEKLNTLKQFDHFSGLALKGLKL